MSHYAVSAIRLDASGHRVTHVLWQQFESPSPKDYYPSEATVLEVVDALSGDDHVHLYNEVNPGEHSLGPEEFHIVVYPGGVEGIEINGYALTDLPTF